MRRSSQRWKPIIETRKKARRPYKGPNKRLKYEYKCNECKIYYPNKQIQVDHLKPVGPLTDLSQLVGYVERLFCEASGLQVLCKTCHQKKTTKSRTI